MEESITDPQLREWMEFFALEPWGSEVEFLRTGIMAATVVNVAPNRKPNAKPASPKDFMPKLGPQPARQGAGALKQELMSVFGDRMKRKKAK